MRKLIVAEFLTLDGIMEASEEWRPPYVSEDVAEAIQTSIHSSDAALLGRVTYQMFAAFWPTQTNNEFGVAGKLNSQPKFVVSSTLDKLEWNNPIAIQETHETCSAHPPHTVECGDGAGADWHRRSRTADRQSCADPDQWLPTACRRTQHDSGAVRGAG
jgi:hypothetical protein